MPPNDLLAAGLPDAFDHRIVVERIRQDEAVRQELGYGWYSGLIRYVAGGENQRGRFAVQVGELALQFDQRMIGASDVAGSAGPGAPPGGRLDHGADDFGVLGHAQVVVRAPNHDFLGALRRMPKGVRESAGDTFQISENPIPAFFP